MEGEYPPPPKMLCAGMIKGPIQSIATHAVANHQKALVEQAEMH